MFCFFLSQSKEKFYLRLNKFYLSTKQKINYNQRIADNARFGFRSALFYERFLPDEHTQLSDEFLNTSKLKKLCIERKKMEALKKIVYKKKKWKYV